MNLFGLSPGELFLIMFVAMIVLGPEKLPETAASIGKWIREFRRATQELTQQFADENPFAEIQRALNFNEEPPTAPATTDAVETPPAAEVAALPAPPTYAPAVVPPPIQSAAAAPVVPRSDYFDRPALFEPIDDRWAHGSLEDFADRVIRRLKPQIEQAIADEWAHGVPVVAVETPIEPISTNGHASSGVSDFVNSLNFAPVASSVGETVEAASNVEISPPSPTVPAGEAEGEVVEKQADVEPPPAAPTNGISVGSVVVRDSEPVGIGSSTYSSSGEDGSLR